MMPEEKVESNIDVKGTLKKFVEAEKPELEQKEAIIKYQEYKRNSRRRRKNDSDDDIEDNTEEQEHLNRIKQELLASLKRVEEMEKEVFNEKDNADKLKVKVQKKNGGGKSSQRAKEERQEQLEFKKQKERE